MVKADNGKVQIAGQDTVVLSELATIAEAIARWLHDGGEAANRAMTYIMRMAAAGAMQGLLGERDENASTSSVLEACIKLVKDAAEKGHRQHA